MDPHHPPEAESKSRSELRWARKNNSIRCTSLRRLRCYPDLNQLSWKPLSGFHPLVEVKRCPDHGVRFPIVVPPVLVLFAPCPILVTGIVHEVAESRCLIISKNDLFRVFCKNTLVLSDRAVKQITLESATHFSSAPDESSTLMAGGSCILTGDGSSTAILFLPLSNFSKLMTRLFETR